MVFDGTPFGFREGDPVAYRPIICRIGVEGGVTVLENHFVYQRVSLAESGVLVDQRAVPVSGVSKEIK